MTPLLANLTMIVLETKWTEVARYKLFTWLCKDLIFIFKRIKL